MARTYRLKLREWLTVRKGVKRVYWTKIVRRKERLQNDYQNSADCKLCRSGRKLCYDILAVASPERSVGSWIRRSREGQKSQAKAENESVKVGMLTSCDDPISTRAGLQSDVKQRHPRRPVTNKATALSPLQGVSCFQLTRPMAKT